MEPLNAALKVFSSLWEQLSHAPSHLLMLLVLISIGILIKRSVVPNAFIPWVLVTIGAGGYPLLASPKNIDPDFPHPQIILCIYGGLLALASVGIHMLVLSKFGWFRKFEGVLIGCEPEPDAVDKSVPPL